MSKISTTEYMDWSGKEAIQHFEFNRRNASYAEIDGYVDECGNVTIDLKKEKGTRQHFILIIPDELFAKLAEEKGFIKED